MAKSPAKKAPDNDGEINVCLLCRKYRANCLPWRDGWMCRKCIPNALLLLVASHRGLDPGDEGG